MNPRLPLSILTKAAKPRTSTSFWAAALQLSPSAVESLTPTPDNHCLGFPLLLEWWRRVRIKLRVRVTLRAWHHRGRRPIRKESFDWKVSSRVTTLFLPARTDSVSTPPRLP